MSTQQEAAYEHRSAAETLKTLREQAATYEPVDQLLQLQRELLRLEQEYSLVSDEFYRRYQAGQMGDDVEIVGWAGRYRLFLELCAAFGRSATRD